MTLADVIERTEADLRLLAKALSAAGYYGDACRMYGMATIVGHDVPEKLAVAEARLKAEAVVKAEVAPKQRKEDSVAPKRKLRAVPR